MPSLGSVPIRVALALAATCPHVWSDFPKYEAFLEKGGYFPTVGILEGMPTCTQRHIAPYRLTSSRTPEKLTRAFLHFCVPKFIP